MKEMNLRRLHRISGIILAVLIILQATTGLVITAKQLLQSQPHTHDHSPTQTSSHGVSSGPEQGDSDLIAEIHHGYGIAGGIYRILLGIGTLVVAGTGITIYMKTRIRMMRKKQ